LEKFFDDYDVEFNYYRKTFKAILQEEESLNEIVKLTGRESLSEDQKVVFEIADIIKNEFLQQNSFSEFDYFCPLYKTLGMMKCITKFYDTSKKIILESPADNKISWNIVSSLMKGQMIKFTKMKEFDPKISEKEMRKKFDDLAQENETKFKELNKNI